MTGVPTPLLFVLAGSNEEAERYMREQMRCIGDLRYITRAKQLDGVDGRGKIMWVVGSAASRPDYFQLSSLAVAHGFAIRQV